MNQGPSKPRRVKIDPVSPAQLPFLQGMRTAFDSVAEVITIRAGEIPNRAHVLFYNEKITYRQTNERGNRVANYLKAQGIKKGDVVSLLILNSPEIYYVMFGTQKLGAIAGLINYMLQGPEIAYLLDDSRPKIVFVGSEFMETFAKGYEMARHKPKVVEVATGMDHGSNISRDQLAFILENYPGDEALVPQQPKDPCLLLYSSGTTGRPKGILLTNEGHLSISKAMASTGIVQGEDVMLILLPMFHVNPISVFTNSMTYCGQTLCIRKAFSPSDFWPSVLDYGVTIVMGVPAMYSYIFHVVEAASIDRSRLKLRFAVCGAAPLPVELIRGFKEKFNVEIIEGYGLSEGTGVTTVNPLLGQRKPGSIGLALPFQDVGIQDDHNRELPAGETGEICIRGDAVMGGYLNNPEATRETIIDGWLHTGDMGYMDEEGYIYVVDRKKDMINRGGENIYPREIEIALEGHPNIREVAVVGVPDEALGERVKAFVIPKEAASLTEQELQEYLKGRLAKYKIPEFVEFVQDLPRNATGKILKKEIRQAECARRKKW